jgi:hypothetical protein
MPTFDGSHPSGSHAGLLTDPSERDAAPFDALAALREQLEERAEQTERTCYVDIPGLGWRLVCSLDFPYSQYARWQKASLPVNQRNRSRGPNLLDLDQAMLSRFVLLGTCQGVEYRNSTDEWVSVADGQGNPIKPDGEEMMARFGEVDPGVFLRKLFGGDAAVMRAGEVVMRAAGWMEADDPDADPTV